MPKNYIITITPAVGMAVGVSYLPKKFQNTSLFPKNVIE